MVENPAVGVEDGPFDGGTKFTTEGECESNKLGMSDGVTDGLSGVAIKASNICCSSPAAKRGELAQ